MAALAQPDRESLADRTVTDDRYVDGPISALNSGHDVAPYRMLMSLSMMMG